MTRPAPPASSAPSVAATASAPASLELRSSTHAQSVVARVSERSSSGSAQSRSTPSMPGDRGLPAVERAHAPALGDEQRDREPAEEAARAQNRYERRHPRRRPAAAARGPGRGREGDPERVPALVDPAAHLVAHARDLGPLARVALAGPGRGRVQPELAAERLQRRRVVELVERPARLLDVAARDRRSRRPATRPRRSRARRPTRRPRSTIFVSDSRPVPQTACMTLRA